MLWIVADSVGLDNRQTLPRVAGCTERQSTASWAAHGTTARTLAEINVANSVGWSYHSLPRQRRKGEAGIKADVVLVAVYCGVTGSMWRDVLTAM